MIEHGVYWIVNSWPNALFLTSCFWAAFFFVLWIVL